MKWISITISALTLKKSFNKIKPKIHTSEWINLDNNIDLGNLTSPIIDEEISMVIKNIQKEKSLGPNGFCNNFFY